MQLACGAHQSLNYDPSISDFFNLYLFCKLYLSDLFIFNYFLKVISSLRISNLELRDDMSPDIAPYINDRKVDIILIRLSNDLAKFKERYITIMDPHVRVLVRLGILRGETGNISKGKVLVIHLILKGYLL